ncbi:MAG TPA: polysaccharide deacetylase family protein, partial [Caldilineaceae bacterium]|nr:polysaccharide deacetylase family protein [Caldilineaceae bacterium]
PAEPSPVEAIPAEAPPATPALSPTPDGQVRTARVPILMYHYLSVPPADADRYRLDLSVTPEQFAAHLDAMQQAGYTTISFYTLIAHLAQGAPLPEKPVILTFDDGYRDNYENAFPLLRAHGMTATFFIVTDFIDKQLPEYLTWDMVREMYAGGMSIESHGRNHVSLANKDHDYLVWQALGSLETIQFELGVRPRFVSYPAGEYDQLTIDIFRSAGYWAGVTTAQGATHRSDDLFRLKRVRVRNSTTSEELLRLLALDW